MRWLPTLIFSPSPSHPSNDYSSNPSSSSSSGRTLKTSASSSSLTDIYHRKKPSSSEGARGAWLFGSGKKSTRWKRFRHAGDHDDSEDDAAVVPMSRSPSSTSDRCWLVVPQPLPLPELSLTSGIRHRDGDCPLPSPKVNGVDATVEAAVPIGFRMRRLFCFFILFIYFV